jgi:hypothetical protein
LMLVFYKLWSPFSPSKVIVFHGKRNLLSMGVIQDNGTATCSLCGVEEEDVKHLFLSCNVAPTIGRSILNLTGLQCTLSQSFGDWFLQFRGLFFGKGIKRKGLVVIFAFLWSI